MSDVFTDGSIETAISELVEGIRKSTVEQTLKEAVDFLESDTKAMRFIAQIENDQRICRKNERVPTIRKEYLKKIATSVALLNARPSWVNFVSSYRNREELAKNLLAALENI